MKILYIIDSYFEPNAGGRDINIHTIANYMHEKGHEVTVLTAREPLKLDFGYNVIWPKGKNTTVVRGKKFLEILKGDYDIASLHDAGGFSFGIKTPIAKILNLKKCPFVYTLHMPEEVHTNWDNMVSTMKEANHVIFVDNFMLKYIKNHDFKNNYSYVPTPINKHIFLKTDIDETLKAKIKSESDMVVTTMSRIDSKKNVKLILEAAESLSSTPRIKFMIIGGGEKHDELKKKLSESGISNVILVGEIPNNRIYKYLELTDVFVNTSNWPGNGRNVLEAMLAGNIVLRRCNDYDDPVMIDGHNYIKFNDVKHLTEILKEIYGNSDDYLSYKANAKSTFDENYSLEIVGAKIERIYKEVIGQ